MPYKDPEKKKEWEKRNRGKGKDHAIWWGYLYLDSAPEDWETRIRESGYEAVWALHDKDVRPTGEVKEPHVHVAIRFASARGHNLKSATEVLTEFGVKGPSVQFRDSWRAVCRYLVHMDDPDKYQYDWSVVRECGGADWLSEINRTSDKYRVVIEMQAWVRDPANAKPNGCPAQFSDLMDFAAENNLEWFQALCDNCALVMREYCKGRRADWKDGLYLRPPRE